MDSAGDVDRISALPDDLLHLILGFMPDATAATRTAALSRRWRRVWIHAQNLAFVDTEVIRGTAPGRLAGFVDWALAQRADADIGYLKIDMSRSPLSRSCCLSPGHVNEWLRYAVQHVSKSFGLHLPYEVSGQRINEPPPVDEPPVELPLHGRMTSISMDLSHFRLQLPMAAAAKYEALTELTLSTTLFKEKPGSGRTLGDFVTSSCPRLRKLDIGLPDWLAQLVLRTETLEELRIFFARDLQALDVEAPRLHVLKLEQCFDKHVENVVRIAAKRLEEIGMRNNYPKCRLPNLDMSGLTSVRRLSPIHLHMHGQYSCGTDIGLWLLKNCPGVEHVDVFLRHWEASNITEGNLVNLISEGVSITRFVSVRSMNMTVIAHGFPERHLVANISSLLLRCPRLRSLCIKIISDGKSWRSNCLCGRLDTWTGDAGRQKISSGSLEEVKISGFTEADEDMELVSAICEFELNQERDFKCHNKDPLYRFFETNDGRRR